MSLDKQFELELNNYKKKLADSRSIAGLAKELLESPHCESWKILDEIFKIAERGEKYAFKELQYQIERSTRNIRSFSMFIYVYSLKMIRKDMSFIYSGWRTHYWQISLDNSEIFVFTAWASSEPSATIVQDSLWLVASTFPSFIKSERIQLTEIELNSVIEWVTFLQTPEPEKYSGACELVKMAKQTHLKVREDYIQKEHLILKKLIEVSGQSPNSSANIFLFIYPFTLREKDINYFCHIYCDFLTDLAEDNICNFFIAITKSAISKQIVFLINKISQLLKNEDEYFKLRIIYQKFILPILTRRAKACTKVEESVYETCSFYILGFLKHCDIGNQGIQCILKNLQKIKSERVRDQWVVLCSIICQRYPESKSLIMQSLKKQLNTSYELDSKEYKQAINDTDTVWEVTLRSGRKHKKYSKVISKMKGIENMHNDIECYIISTVQGLQKTGLLQNLLDKYKDPIKERKLPLLDQMRILFNQISGKKKADRIVVSYLKKKGPHQFTESSQQEDVHQYIIQLFDSMEGEMKKIPNMLEQFKKIFEIKTINITECSVCKAITETEEKSYSYTIPHTEMLSNETIEPLPDYVCDSCQAGKGSCVIKRELVPESMIMIIHINRFSHENGKAKKELSTQTILRNFMDYELVGMICHIGKNVEQGHYIYYSRITRTKWAQFNDKYVEEFDLSTENQEFQREMKAEMTPYILFYEKFT